MVAKAYTGELDFELTESSLAVERLIVRPGEIAFSLLGMDSDGRFVVEGTAKETAIGTYVASSCSISRPPLNEMFEGGFSIVFEVVSPNVRGECVVEATWNQDGEGFLLSGVLSEFNRSRLR